MLDNIDMSFGCKSYEGTIEINMEYPNYFEGYSDVPNLFTITVHCYVLGDARHTDFKGKTFKEALDKFEHWIEVEETKKWMGK